MRCIKDHILTRFLDGNCTAGEAERLSHHLKECRRCRERLETIRREIDFVRHKTGALDPPLIPEDIPLFARPVRSWNWVLKPAAALLLFALLTLAILLLRPGPFGSDGEENGWPQRRSIVAYVRAGGQPAQAIIIKERATRTTLIWVERKTVKQEEKNENPI